MDSVLCPQGNINSKLIVILDFVGLFVSNYAMRSSEVGHIDLSPQSIIRAVYFGTNHDFCGILEASYSHRPAAGPSAQGRARDPCLPPSLLQIAGWALSSPASCHAMLGNRDGRKSSPVSVRGERVWGAIPVWEFSIDILNQET